MQTILSPYSRPSDRAREVIPRVLAGSRGVYLFTDIYEAYCLMCRRDQLPVESRQAVGIALYQLGHIRVRSGVNTAWDIQPSRPASSSS